MTNDEEILFMGIKDPAELRRAVVESSNGIVESLERYERFNSIRARKIAEITRLKSTIREISKLIHRLRSELPKTELPQIKKEKKPKAVKKPRAVIQPKARSKPVPTKEHTELEKLESELDEIDKKLSGIS